MSTISKILKKISSVLKSQHKKLPSGSSLTLVSLKLVPLARQLAGRAATFRTVDEVDAAVEGEVNRAFGGQPPEVQALFELLLDLYLVKQPGNVGRGLVDLRAQTNNLRTALSQYIAGHPADASEIQLLQRLLGI